MQQYTLDCILKVCQTFKLKLNIKNDNFYTRIITLDVSIGYSRLPCSCSYGTVPQIIDNTYTFLFLYMRNCTLHCHNNNFRFHEIYYELSIFRSLVQLKYKNAYN